MEIGRCFEVIAEDVETRFDTSDSEVNRSLPIGKNNKKITGVMKDESGEKIAKENVAVRLKMYSYLTEQPPYKR